MAKLGRIRPRDHEVVFANEDRCSKIESDYLRLPGQAKRGPGPKTRMSVLREIGAAVLSTTAIGGYGSPLSAGTTLRELRPYRRQPRHGREAGLAGIATHDGLALGITQ